MILSIHFQVVPNIQKGNEGIVHHIILHECSGNFNENDFDQGVRCSQRGNMPYLKCQYSSIVAAWAVGGDVSKIKLAISSKIYITLFLSVNEFTI